MASSKVSRVENLERLSCQFQVKIDLPGAYLLRYLKSAPTGQSAKEMLMQAAHFVYDPFDLHVRWQNGLISEEEYRRKARWALLQLEAWLNYAHQELCLDPFRQTSASSLATVESAVTRSLSQPDVLTPDPQEHELLTSAISNDDNPFASASQSGRRSQILGSVIDEFHRVNAED
ncbi:hypothetical protein [Leptolyngbya sp. AN10]|uniref:hypothetical protein n=1 Tax=Leptolyngbya sp. AN10 TaxID=3423365 RepID=UPI003D3169F3